MKLQRMTFYSVILDLLTLLTIIVPCADAGPDGWHWRNPLPQGNDLYGITYGNGIFVAVGSSGTVITSPDATAWTQREADIIKTTLYDVHHGNDLFVAVGGDEREKDNSGVITTSPDGINWTARASQTFGTLRAVTYGNGLYVAVGNNGTVVTSSDGVSWMQRTAVTSQSLNGVAYGNGLFVAVGGGAGHKETVVLTSTDGVTWMPPNPGVDDGLFGITFANGRFVAVGNNRIVLISTDGTNWAQGRIESPPGAVTFFAVQYANGLHVAVGSGLVATSTDGGIWNVTRSDIAEIHDVAYGNGTFVVVGHGGAIVASPDGSSWASKTSGTSYRLNGVTHGNSVFVAVGYDIAQHCGLLLTSPDGVLWSSRLSGITNMLHAAAHANDIFGGLFVAVGDNGLILASQDGIQWSIVNADPRYSLRRVIYGSGLFVAAGADAILTSQDGIRWTRTSTAAGGNLLAFGNGVFVTLGAVSSDGVHWTPVDAPSKENFELNDMTFGNGLFVAVGGTLHVGFAPPSPIHIITTSPDGIHWTTRSTEGPPLRGVAYENGAFMAVGHNGAVLTSPDGINWFPKVPKTTHSLSAAGYGNGAFVAVGEGGTILQSFSRSSRNDCAATLSRDLLLHVPVVAFNGQLYQADFRYVLDVSELVLKNASTGPAASQFINCTPAVLSSDGTLHVPDIEHEGVFYGLSFDTPMICHLP